MDQPNHRMNCFPFIEKHESNFIYGDATVTYSSNFDVPFYLQRDNSHIKSIFIVRDPISRLESHFRFSLRLMKSLGYDTVDKAVAYALRSESPLHFLRQDAELLLMALQSDKSSKETIHGVISIDDCLSNLWILYFRFEECADLLFLSGTDYIDTLHEKDKISHYVSKFFISGGTKTKNDRVASLIVRTSLYFPGNLLDRIELAILIISQLMLYDSIVLTYINNAAYTFVILLTVIAHWSQVLKPENVHVVENEKLSLSNRPNVVLEMKKIHRYSSMSIYCLRVCLDYS